MCCAILLLCCLSVEVSDNVCAFLCVWLLLVRPSGFPYILFVFSSFCGRGNDSLLNHWVILFCLHRYLTRNNIVRLPPLSFEGLNNLLWLYVFYIEMFNLWTCIFYDTSYPPLKKMLPQISGNVNSVRVYLPLK